MQNWVLSLGRSLAGDHSHQSINEINLPILVQYWDSSLSYEKGPVGEERIYDTRVPQRLERDLNDSDFTAHCVEGAARKYVSKL